MNALNHLSRTVMRSPIVWGVLACAAFYGLIYGGPLDLPVIHRYFTHHPVEYGETLLFSVGMAALMLRLADVVVQRSALGKSPWEGRRSAANCRWRNFAEPCWRSWRANRRSGRMTTTWAGSARRCKYVAVSVRPKAWATN